MNGGLVPYNPHVSLSEQTYKQVARLEDIKELYKYQNVAAAARDLAKQAKEPKIVWNYCMANAIWARWKIGRLIPKSGIGKGEKSTTLVDLGIDNWNESHRWQLLARIDEDILHTHISSFEVKAKKPTGEVYDKLQADPNARRMLEKFGKLFQVEIDALDPADAERYLREAIEPFVDQEAFEREQRKERRERTAMRKRVT